MLSAFLEGWDSYSSCGGTGVSKDDAAAKVIPPLTPPMIGESLTHVARQTRSELIDIFSYPYVGLSIDRITIKCKHLLNIDVFNPISNILPFTYDCLEKNTFRTIDFIDHFAPVPTRMSSEYLKVTGVISDR
jgi:hypothetical protein